MVANIGARRDSVAGVMKRGLANAAAPLKWFAGRPLKREIYLLGPKRP